VEEKMQDLINDSRAALSVREAALELKISTYGSDRNSAVRPIPLALLLLLRHHQHRKDSPRSPERVPQTLIALATDDSAPLPLRCTALSLMSLLDSEQERLRVIEIALTIAGVQHRLFLLQWRDCWLDCLTP
jgi:hypothetical protein